MQDNQPQKNYAGIALHVFFAVLVYLSWHWPKTQLSAFLAIAAALLLAFICRSGRISAKKIYISGCIINTLGFYWLAETVSFFGGFPKIFGFMVLLLFIALSSLQFILFAWIYNNLPKVLGAFCLPLAWYAAEFLSPRIFPWELSTPLIALPVLTQVADIAGSYFVSFILLLSSAYLIRLAASKHLATIFSCLCLISAWLGYGQLVISKTEEQLASSHSDLILALVQANVEVVQQGDMAVIKQNKEEYVKLTQNLTNSLDLIIWPEAVIQDWIHVATGNAASDLRIPYFQSNLLAGALTFESQEVFFNSALFIKADGSIPAPYHKRILMPFGEYMPFSEAFPWLNEINKNLALFTPGKNVVVMDLEKASFSPLICYEDLMPRLSQESVRQGANFLVNLTNDAWFGKGPAAIHHSLIASYRAIENKRYLVRSTNTGLTEVVDPLGRTAGFLAPDTEGILNSRIQPFYQHTIYTDYMPPFIYWGLALAVLSTALLSRVVKK